MNSTFKSIEKKRLTWDEYFASIAQLTAARSACSRLNVGCVITLNNRIVSTGYNGFITGAPHNSIVVNDHEQATVHAEQNAVADAAKRGQTITGATAYITHFPCINCFKLLAQSGITTINYINDYKNDPIVHTLLDGTCITFKQLDI
tara:strand:+ start:277 stop:717 length:441 start_codon:yes stop_codon:yes gene_type:complete